MRALVRANLAGAVFLDLHGGKEARASAAAAVGGEVVLRQDPKRRFVVSYQRAGFLPLGKQRCRVLVRIAASGRRLRQVDADDVERRAGSERGALGRVNHVVRRRENGLETADAIELIAQRIERANVGHAPTLEHAGPKQPYHLELIGAWRSLVAHLLWEQGVGGSNPLAPI